jgi:hypothetical protein
VQLDRVGGDSGLAVFVVEERDADDLRASAQTHGSARRAHLRTSHRGGPAMHRRMSYFRKRRHLPFERRYLTPVTDAAPSTAFPITKWSSSRCVTP